MQENPYKSPDAELEVSAVPAPRDPLWVTAAKISGSILATLMFALLVFWVRVWLFGDP